MPRYDFECQECKNCFEIICFVSERNNQCCPKCSSGNLLRFIGIPAICGTRDNFGVMKSFQDEETGETIDNWKSWEKSGYRKPQEVVKNHDLKEKIKRKMDKIKHDKEKGEFNG